MKDTCETCGDKATTHTHDSSFCKFCYFRHLDRVIARLPTRQQLIDLMRKRKQ